MLSITEAWNYVKSVGKVIIGEMKGVAAVGVGAAQAVAHPVKTAKALGNAVAHPIETAIAVGSAVSTAVSKANTPEQAGKIVGEGIANIGLAAASFVGGGAAEVTNGLSEAANIGKVEKVIQGIEELGADEKINTKNPATLQEGNATINFGEGTSTNIRIETHPLTPGGDPIRHGNVETFETVGGRKVLRDNVHVEN